MMKDTLLGDVVANDTEMIHEAYLAGEESEESKNARHVLRAMIVIFFTTVLVFSDLQS